MLYDISVLVGGDTPAWPGDTPFDCRWTWRRAAGDSVNVSALSMSPHVGTHADAPLHVRDGADGSHRLPLDAFIGPAHVVSLAGLSHDVTIEQLDAVSARRDVERLLLRTGRGIADGSFPPDWPALTEACTRVLLGRGLRLLGVDAPSVDRRESKTLGVHHLLFSHGASVLENLDLRTVPDGDYELLALPLRLEGLDATPVRAVLRR